MMVCVSVSLELPAWTAVLSLSTLAHEHHYSSHHPHCHYQSPGWRVCVSVGGEGEEERMVGVVWAGEEEEEDG